MPWTQPRAESVTASDQKEPTHPICHPGSNHTYMWTTHMLRSNDNHCAYGLITHVSLVYKTILVLTALGACCADPSFYLVAERVFGVSTARAPRNGHLVARPSSLRSTRAPYGSRRCETVLGCILPKEVSETGGAQRGKMEGTVAKPPV